MAARRRLGLAAVLVTLGASWPFVPPAGAVTHLVPLRGSAPTGGVPGEGFGVAVAAPGDLNGDGYADFAVGAAWSQAESEHVGHVYLYWGGPGFDAIPDLVLSDGPGGLFGLRIEKAGDVNGDGHGDLLVSAPTRYPSGQVRLYFGGPDIDDVPDLTLNGCGFYFGIGLGGADLDGDGYSDIVVGAPYCGNGTFVVYRGGAAPDPYADQIFTWPQRIYLGYAIAAADMSGDGRPDVVTSALTYGNGAAFVYNEGPGSDLNPDRIITSPFDSYFAYSAAVVGDVSGDGQPDLLVGARVDGSEGSFGRAYLYHGSMDNTQDLVFYGPAANDGFGSELAPAGDFDGDGHSDIAIAATAVVGGSPGPTPGKVYLYRGGPGADAAADAVITDGVPGDAFGIAIAPAGDVDGDGLGDLIIGAHSNDVDGTNAGKAFLVLQDKPVAVPGIASAAGLRVLPNPARVAATLRWSADAGERASLMVLDVHGRRVRDLPAESGEARWDLRDASGRRVTPGLYFCELRSGETRSVRRLLVVR